ARVIGVAHAPHLEPRKLALDAIGIVPENDDDRIEARREGGPRRTAHERLAVEQEQELVAPEARRAAGREDDARDGERLPGLSRHGWPLPSLSGTTARAKTERPEAPPRSRARPAPGPPPRGRGRPAKKRGRSPRRRSGSGSPPRVPADRAVRRTAR